jgi:hypothetical protein
MKRWRRQARLLAAECAIAILLSCEFHNSKYAFYLSLVHLGENKGMCRAGLDAGRQIPALAEITFYPCFSLPVDYPAIAIHGTGPAAHNKNQLI